MFCAHNQPPWTSHAVGHYMTLSRRMRASWASRRATSSPWPIRSMTTGTKAWSTASQASSQSTMWISWCHCLIRAPGLQWPDPFPTAPLRPVRDTLEKRPAFASKWQNRPSFCFFCASVQFCFHKNQTETPATPRGFLAFIREVGQKVVWGHGAQLASEAQISMRPLEDGTVFVYVHVCVRLCIFDSLFLYYNAASTHSCSFANSAASSVETVLLIIFQAVFLPFLTLTCLPVLPH